MSDAVGRRYAKALFELAKENKSLDKVAKSLNELSYSLDEVDGSADLRDFVNSPLYSRDEQVSVIREIAKKAKYDGLVSNTLAVMASRGRLNVIPGMISAFFDMMNAENDEVIATVTSVKKMTAAQTKKLAEVLKTKVGKDVTIHSEVDPDILGGLTISIGSTLIDNSLKGKLSKLRNTMKEVG